MRPSRLVFITGGTGYMGRRVIPALLARGHRVRAGDRRLDRRNTRDPPDAHQGVRTMQWKKDGFTISTEKEKLDRGVIHEFLRNSYWAKGIPRELVDRSIENSLCFGLYEGDRLVGFARVISDNATFAYLSDVFVLESHRGRGLATWFMETVMAHPDLQGIRRWMLATADAHGLYRRVGFTPLSRPERIMEKLLTDAYSAGR
jgi:GNAT superfamily N-acetyltransferase